MKLRTAKKIMHGFKNETREAKIKWMLSMSLARRYEMNVGVSDFLRSARKNRDYLNARRPSKNIQVLKQK